LQRYKGPSCAETQRAIACLEGSNRHGERAELALPVRSLNSSNATTGNLTMRHFTTITGTAFVLGLAAQALWSPDANACMSCTVCGQTCTQTATYTPAAYTSGAAGDVAVNNASESPLVALLVEPVVNQLGGSTYEHTKLLVTPPAGYNVGSYFAETFPNVTPPGSQHTGEESPCSKPFSPYYMQRMSPGAAEYYEDAQPGVLVKSFGNAKCAPPADGYHIATLLRDSVKGGTCEKELVDYCGVPVQYNAAGTAGDRTTYNATEGFNALNAAFTGVYNECMKLGSGTSIWEEISVGISCGDGITAEILCQRTAWQVVNEVMYAAYPQEFYGLDAHNSACGSDENCGWMDVEDGDRVGWSDFNVVGPPPNPAGPYPDANWQTWPALTWPPSAAMTSTMLGAGKSNNQMTAGTIAGGVGGSLVAGACDNNCNQAPMNIAGWAPSNFVANIPQNIVNAAGRLGKTAANGGIVNVSVGSGISQGYTTYTYSDCHCNECVCAD
jgi:hypothetical protein